MDPMTRDELEAAGAALYGDEWTAPLATALGIRPRTVRRWREGSAAVPAPVERAIAALLQAKLHARTAAEPRPAGPSIRHLTLNSGHLRESPRSEVREEMIALLRPVVHQALTAEPAAIPHTDPPCTLSGGTAEDGCALTIWGPPLGEQRIPIVTVGIALSARSSRQVWRALRDHAPLPLPEVAIPLPPWLAVRIDPGLALYPQTQHWLGDMERCLAWVWMEEVNS